MVHNKHKKPVQIGYSQKEVVKFMSSKNIKNEKNFENLYAQEIETLRTALEVIEPQEQKEMVKWIPDMIEHLVDKRIIDDKSKK